MAFIDLTKAFDLVSRSGLFRRLEKIGCPPKLRNLVISFHSGMKGRVSFDGSGSELFSILSGVKQGCVLAPTLFGIFFSLLLRYAFNSSNEGIYLHSRNDGKLFKMSRLLKSKSKVSETLIRELLFADDAALTSHSVADLQRLIDRFNNACIEFGLTISLKKTVVMAQDANEFPSFNINDHMLEIVDEFTYLGSTICANLSLDKEIDRRIGKAASTMSKLSKRVWENKCLTANTKIRIYQACVLSTLLYGSESWTTYMRQERRLNTFHLRCLRRILGIRWQDKVSNSEILARTRVHSMFSLLSQRRLRWLGHTHRMDAYRVPRNLLYGELAFGSRRQGRPMLRFKDVCKRDMKSCGIDSESWELMARERQKWRRTVTNGIATADAWRNKHAAEKRLRRKHNILTSTAVPPDTGYACEECGQTCLSRIGLFSHMRAKHNPAGFAGQ